LDIYEVVTFTSFEVSFFYRPHEDINSSPQGF